MSATDTSRRQLYLLAGLAALLAAVLYFEFGRGGAVTSTAAPAGNGAQPSNQAASAGGRALPVSDVKLDALNGGERPLAAADRNPFRFEQKAPPPAPPAPVAPPRQTAAPPPVALGPPPPPPIPLKFVGWLNATAAQADRVAILADARGNPFYGKEGDIIEGRYRLLRIAADSVDVAYADGRGRQTIRLQSQ
jgi:hypothetical protein